MPGASVRRLRAWAVALPSVTETTRPRSGAPVWRVDGRAFLEVGPQKGRATFSVPERSASTLAAVHPEYARVVRRPGARRGYSGLEVQLRSVSGARLYRLVLEAWAAKASAKRVRAIFDAGGRLPKPPRTRSAS